MSWLYSRALAEEFSRQSCSAGEPSVPSNWNRIELSGYAIDKTKAFYRPFRSGTETLPISTEDHGEDLLTWFQEASRVRTSAPPILTLKEFRVRVLDYGKKCGESFAKWDRDTSSWRTRQCSLAGDWELFSETWPKWGLMRSGECWALMTSARFTGEIEFTSWATPTVCGNNNRKGASAKSGDGLGTQVKAWPVSPRATPIERDYKDSPGMATETDDRKRLDTLPRQVFAHWPTALESNGRKGGPNQKGSKGDLTLPSAVSLWPTIDASKRGGPQHPEKRKDGGHQVALQDAMMLWPTVTASRGGSNAQSESVMNEGHGTNLQGAVTLWKTPTVACATGGQKSRGGARQGELLLGGEVQIAFGEMLTSSNARTENTAPLNPDFAEWLMGWPIGWTASQPLEMGRFQQWLPQWCESFPVL
jgi:hypothetical protein